MRRVAQADDGRIEGLRTVVLLRRCGGVVGGNVSRQAARNPKFRTGVERAGASLLIPALGSFTLSLFQTR